MNNESRHCVSSRIAGLVAGLVCASVLLPAVAAQTTFWVDDDGDNGDLGTQIEPWKTLTFAVDNVAAGDTIKVKPGTYDAGSNGETFPIPVPDGVLILGSEASQGSWPRIGGDAGAVEGVFTIIADSGTDDVDGSRLQRLYFVGEDTASVDAPPAVYVRIDDSKRMIRSGVLDCYFERSEMNGAGTDNPVIRVEVGWTPTISYFGVVDSEIWATARGGIECVTLATDGGDIANMKVEVDGCEIKVTGSDSAEFGIFVGGGTASADARWTADLSRNVIDSYDVSTPGSNGFLTGIDLFMDAADDKNYRFMTGSVVVSHIVAGCRGDAFRLRMETDFESSSVTNAVVELLQNHFRDNGRGATADSVGAGVHVDFNETDEHGYASVLAWSNMIVDNAYGYYFEAFTEDTEGQVGVIINDTIAGNANEAFWFDGTFNISGAPGPALVNCLVWGNNGDAEQHGGSAGWDPCINGGMSHSNWLDLIYTTDCDGSEPNLDVEPYFVNPGSGNYRLSSGSITLIDKGDELPVPGLSDFDFEGDDRVIDGGEDPPSVDIGADEYDPP